MKIILIVAFFSGFIHMMETLALSMRLAGARTKQIASSISFVNITFLMARMSNMLQAPLLGLMVDHAVRAGDVVGLIEAFRIFLLAAFLGNLAGALLTPAMVKIFEAGILIFEKKGSLPSVIKTAVKPRNFLKIIRSLHFPRLGSLKHLEFSRIPHGFIYFNIFMVGIYAVGVLGALLAGAMVPQYRATAVQLSGIVNGMATIMLAMMVDPSSAHITDQAVRGKRPVNDVRVTVFYLIGGRLIATLIVAQLLLVPAAKYIAWVTMLLARLK